MSRSPVFDNFKRAMRIALYCQDNKISTAEGLERVAAEEARAAVRRANRREFLADVGRFAAAGALASVAGPLGAASAVGKGGGGSSLNVGIVGAGLAGLACADQLRANGVAFTLYEASGRVGGRCFSFVTNEFFPDQSAERGGEFIDTGHKTLLNYANEFNLPREDVNKVPGEIYYVFGGVRHDESVVVDEFRDAVAAMQDDFHRLSGAPTADLHNDADAELDLTNLREYLEAKVAGPVARAAIDEAYLAEFGLETHRQSCLNFLLFIHLDKRSKFTPFGIFSDERFHIHAGNDLIAKRIRDRLRGAVQHGMRLVRIHRLTGGEVELTFTQGSKTVTRTHGAVVIAIPFTVLRDVEMDLDPSVPAERDKRIAIEELGYGTNAKQMIRFNGRPWAALDPPGTGTSYSDLPSAQTTWETNPSQATDTHAVLTDYASGDRGAALNPKKVQTEAGRFLADLDKVFPGALAAAFRDSRGRFQAHIEHWPSNPLTKGSYTCYMPGQFTRIAGNEGKPIGNVHFAGEHANSFYVFQGFMEGAALSGIDASAEILAKIKAGAL